jgi:hypothetical protein
MTHEIGKKMKVPSTLTRRQNTAVPVEKKATELNPAGLMQNRKLKAILSESEQSLFRLKY